MTAAVWKEAHDYHRQQQRFHALLSHGPGIITGLSVLASDPPDSTLYILPGMAVDPEGETIVVTEPVAYDVGLAHGLQYLLLSYEQSRPTASGTQTRRSQDHSTFTPSSGSRFDLPCPTRRAWSWLAFGARAVKALSLTPRISSTQV